MLGFQSRPRWSQRGESEDEVRCTRFGITKRRDGSGSMHVDGVWLQRSRRGFEGRSVPDMRGL